MKVISAGKKFELYGDSLKTYDMLPAQAYTIRFSKMSGFYLEEHAPIEIKEEKIYGVHMEKIVKVLRSFELFERNLGVILSGNKGIGKSLFAKLLSIEAVKRGIPLIIVDQYIPGIASYIEEIEQEVMVLFDEFDKTFGNIKVGDNNADPQAGLLSLFDGVAQGKKLFVITCNGIKSLNDYLINRPGRFHYHFRFDYPSAEEITEYLTDKLSSEYYGQINDVIAFSKRVNLNYDCLRAIAFELNLGLSFQEAIKDLNIINMNAERYNLILYCQGGVVYKQSSVCIDLFAGEGECSTWMDAKNGDEVRISFDTANAYFDSKKCMYVVNADDIKVEYFDNDGAEKKKGNPAPEYISITRVRDKDIHYTV